MEPYNYRKRRLTLGIKTLNLIRIVSAPDSLSGSAMIALADVFCVGRAIVRSARRCRRLAAGGHLVRVAVPALQRAQLEPRPGLLTRRLPHDVGGAAGALPPHRAPLQRRHRPALLRRAAARGHHLDVRGRLAAAEPLPDVPRLAVLPRRRQPFVAQALHVLAHPPSTHLVADDHQQEAGGDGDGDGRGDGRGGRRRRRSRVIGCGRRRRSLTVTGRGHRWRSRSSVTVTGYWPRSTMAVSDSHESPVIDDGPGHRC